MRVADLGFFDLGVFISALAPQDVLALTDQPADQSEDATAVLLAYVHFYDQL